MERETGARFVQRDRALQGLIPKTKGASAQAKPPALEASAPPPPLAGMMTAGRGIAVCTSSEAHIWWLKRNPAKDCFPAHFLPSPQLFPDFLWPQCEMLARHSLITFGAAHLCTTTLLVCIRGRTWFSVRSMRTGANTSSSQKLLS